MSVNTEQPPKPRIITQGDTKYVTLEDYAKAVEDAIRWMKKARTFELDLQEEAAQRAELTEHNRRLQRDAYKLSERCKALGYLVRTYLPEDLTDDYDHCA